MHCIRVSSDKKQFRRRRPSSSSSIEGEQQQQQQQQQQQEQQQHQQQQQGWWQGQEQQEGQRLQHKAIQLPPEAAADVTSNDTACLGSSSMDAVHMHHQATDGDHSIGAHHHAVHEDRQMSAHHQGVNGDQAVRGDRSTSAHHQAANGDPVAWLPNTGQMPSAAAGIRPALDAIPAANTLSALPLPPDPSRCVQDAGMGSMCQVCVGG